MSLIAEFFGSCLIELLTAPLAGAPAKGAASLLYPAKCAICGKIGEESICAFCHVNVTYIKRPYCETCGLPCETQLCRRCATEIRYFDRARSVGLYQGTLATAVKRFKYKPSLALGDPLSLHLIKYLQSVEGQAISGVDLIMPIPIHKHKERERGFNQASILAKKVSESLKIPYDDKTLIRCRSTQKQAGLTADERASNLVDAFQTTKLVQKARILLIDDVMTTGVTFNECAKVLKQAGASAVYGLSLAREE